MAELLKIFFFSCYLFLLPMLFATDYYVKVQGSGNKDGSTWDNAMDNGRFSFKLCNKLRIGDKFHLASGTYIPFYGKNNSDIRSRTFLINSGISLVGDTTKTEAKQMIISVF